MSRACGLCLLLLLLAGALASGQAGGTDAAADASQEDASRPAPEEYREEEFSRGLKALRRGEIIMLGSLPFSLFFTFEVFDLYRYAANDFDPAYSPWPFRRPGAAPLHPRGERRGARAPRSASPSWSP